MFYYMVQPVLAYNWILIAAAVLPAVFLMIKAYKSDRIEKESGALLRRLAVMGILSTLLARVEERLGQWLLAALVAQDTVLYNVLLYFVIVAIAEESSKYLVLRRQTWNNPEFNCQYDGVVYALFVSMGFALWENISYVLTYGFSTALVRAVTAIPGHACFGVFMGVFYGLAKRCDNGGRRGAGKAFRVCAVAAPALLHGAYDYIATLEQTQGGWYFLIFAAVLFLVSFLLVNRTSKTDRYIA